MIAKSITTLIAGTMLMASSKIIQPPLFVHCIAADEKIEQNACSVLVRKLRDQKLNRAIAAPDSLASQAGIGMHVTLHVVDTGDATFQSFLSWGDAGNAKLEEQTKGPVLDVDKSQLASDVGVLIDTLITKTRLPI